MFIPKENRIAVFSYLFQEGVCVVKKDPKAATHPHIEGPTTHKATSKRPDSRDREEDKFAGGGRPAFNDNRAGGFGRGGGI